MSTAHGVLGCSLSAFIDGATPPWPTLAWGMDVTNAARPGFSAQDLVDLDYWRGAIHNSDEWWLLIGSNDIAGGTHPAYEYNVMYLVEEMHSLGAQHIHLMHSPRLWEAFGGPQKEVPELLEQRAIDQHICADLGYVTCGPDLYELLDQREYFVADGVHMSDLGKQITATAVVPEPSFFLMLLASLITLVIIAGVRRMRRPTRFPARLPPARRGFGERCLREGFDMDRDSTAGEAVCLDRGLAD